MDRGFEGRVDAEGLIDIPSDIRSRHGLVNGARIAIEERGKDLVISPIEIEDISDLAGILTKGDPVGELLKERALDRERENAKFQ